METPNLNYIKELADGDAFFEEKILSVLKNEFPQEVKLFKKNFELKDYNEAANNVHKIKHKISLLGMTNCLEQASQFEIDLRNGEIERSSHFFNILQKIHVYLEC